MKEGLNIANNISDLTETVFEWEIKLVSCVHLIVTRVRPVPPARQTTTFPKNINIQEFWQSPYDFFSSSYFVKTKLSHPQFFRNIFWFRMEWNIVWTKEFLSLFVLQFDTNWQIKFSWFKFSFTARCVLARPYCMMVSVSSTAPVGCGETSTSSPYPWRISASSLYDILRLKNSKKLLKSRKKVNLSY